MWQPVEWSLHTCKQCLVLQHPLNLGGHGGNAATKRLALVTFALCSVPLEAQEQLSKCQYICAPLTLK